MVACDSILNGRLVAATVAAAAAARAGRARLGPAFGKRKWGYTQPSFACDNSWKWASGWVGRQVDRSDRSVASIPPGARGSGLISACTSVTQSVVSRETGVRASVRACRRTCHPIQFVRFSYLISWHCTLAGPSALSAEWRAPLVCMFLFISATRRLLRACAFRTHVPGMFECAGTQCRVCRV